MLLAMAIRPIAVNAAFYKYRERLWRGGQSTVLSGHLARPLISPFGHRNNPARIMNATPASNRVEMRLS